MAQYAKKTCNTCGIRDIQPNMYRTEKSRKTGSSNNTVTAGNALRALAGNKAALKKTKRSIVANNRRTYTRITTVWMCYECSGQGDSVRNNVQKTINKGEEVLSSACSSGWFSSPADEMTQIKMATKIESLRALEGETFNGVQQQAKDLVGELQFMYDMGKTKKGAEKVSDRKKEETARAERVAQKQLNATDEDKARGRKREKEGLRNLAFGLVGAAIVVTIHMYVNANL